MLRGNHNLWIRVERKALVLSFAGRVDGGCRNKDQWIQGHISGNRHG